MEDTSAGSAPLVVVMGVSGSGKTTVAQRVAARLSVDFGEADDFHPPRNIEKMESGRALDDEDRAPWLAAIAAWLAEHDDRGAVVTCSALKRAYRDRVRAEAPRVVFLHLQGSQDVLAERMRDRSGHFMPGSLLDSQLSTLEPLEPDEAGLTLDVADLPADVVARAVSWLEARHDA